MGNHPTVLPSVLSWADEGRRDGNGKPDHSEVHPSPPEEVSHDELVAYMSHLKWLVDTSDLSGGIKQSLLSKLEAAGAG